MATPLLAIETSKLATTTSRYYGAYRCTWSGAP